MSSKRQRRKWWKGLSAEEKAAYVEKKVQAKGKQRRQKDEKDSARLVKKFGAGKTCTTCLHHKIGACEGLSTLDKVCKDWFEIAA